MLRAELSPDHSDDYFETKKHLCSTSEVDMTNVTESKKEGNQKIMPELVYLLVYPRVILSQSFPFLLAGFINL